MGGIQHRVLLPVFKEPCCWVPKKSAAEKLPSARGGTQRQTAPNKAICKSYQCCSLTSNYCQLVKYSILVWLSHAASWIAHTSQVARCLFFLSLFSIIDGKNKRCTSNRRKMNNLWVKGGKTLRSYEAAWCSLIQLLYEFDSRSSTLVSNQPHLSANSALLSSFLAYSFWF